MIIEIQHETTLQYSESIKEWLAEVRMEPISDERQTCHSFHVAVSQPTQVYRYLDGFGNRVHHFNLVAPHQQIRVLAASVVETDERPSDLLASQAALPLDLGGSDLAIYDLLQLRGPVRSTQRLDPILAELKPRPGQRVGSWLYQVGDYIISRFKYARDVTDATSPIDDLLRYGKGVCQDFAHLMLAICRANGVPARYVSGYIHRPKKESQSHAWCEVWLPDLSWLGFDPTNGCPATERFVKVAMGRDFTDVPPNKGTYRGQGQETISVRVATRQLERLPSISWQEQLPPLDAPATAITRFRHEQEGEEQAQQQQQQQ
jgi:transglutaminase-like putative cysteine protease